MVVVEAAFRKVGSVPLELAEDVVAEVVEECPRVDLIVGPRVLLGECQVV